MPGNSLQMKYCVAEPRKGCKHFRFDTTREVTQLIQLQVKNKDYWQASGFESGDTSWNDSKSPEEAIEHYLYGRPNLTALTVTTDAALNVPRLIESEFEPTADVTGGCVDIGNYLTGVPECMVNFNVQQRRKKTVSLLFNIAASCGVSADQIKTRGFTVASICDYLEKSGYRVRLDISACVMSWHQSKDANYHFTMFCGKDYNQPLDFARVGFMLGSAAMLRRIGFCLWGSSQEFRDDMGSSAGCLGYPGPVPTTIGNEYDYVFDYQQTLNQQSAEKCVEYILSGKANQLDVAGELEE